MVSIDPDAVEHIPAEAARTYTKLAARYGQTYYRPVGDAIAPQLQREDRLLDAGTGPGILPVSLAARTPGVRIDAFDFTRELVEYGREEARRRGVDDRVAFFAADCYAIPVRDRSYSSVLCTGLLHSPDEPAAAFAEFHRVLEPGGTAWVFDPTIFDVPDELDIELNDHEREVFRSYGVQSGGDERPISLAEARRLVDDSSFGQADIEVGERGDIRLTLTRSG